MSTFVLKLIACIAMLIDHVTKLFVDETSVLWTIGCGVGRLAFPIFCFLIAEGFARTRDRKKYGLRLLIAALISEIPYDLMRFGTVWNFDSQNVMWTLLFGYVAMALMDYVRVQCPGDRFRYTAFSCMTILMCGIAAMFFGTDYSVYGAMLILVFDAFRKSKFWAFAMHAVLTLGFYSAAPLQLVSLAAVLFWGFYNGKKGPDDRYCLYAFYPVHMLILGLLARFVL